MGIDLAHVRIAQLASFTALFQDEAFDPDAFCAAHSLVKSSNWRQNRTTPLPAAGKRPSTRRLLADFFDETIPAADQTDAWVLDLNRQFDWLAWALQMASTSPGEKQLAKTAVFGSEELVLQTPNGPYLAKGALGGPVFVTPAPTCQEVAAFTATLSVDMVAAVVDVPQMRSASLYRMGRVHADEVVHQSVVRQFVTLRDFYAQVAQAGHEVLVEVG